MGDFMLLIDQNQILIRDYKEMMIMDSHHFRIRMNHYDLHVMGKQLEIYYYDQNEIRLNGHVKVIEYDEDRV